MNKYIGIDLGSSNISIYQKDKNKILIEPNIIVIDVTDNKVIAIGKEAKNMLGKLPRNYKIIKPIKEGVIADFELTEIILKSLIKKIDGNNIITKPKILVNYPTNITEVEKETILELIRNIGAKKIYLEETCKLSAIGAGLKINRPSGNLIIDIGGQTTDIAVISLNNIVISTSINIAGDKFEQDIIQYIRERYQLLIGEGEAEKIKIKFANIYKPQNKKITIKGRNLITGLPMTIELNQEDTKRALQESIKNIIEKINKVIEKTPPELLSDIMDRGIILTGGSSQLTGLQQVLKERLNIEVLIAQSPLTCTIDGIKQLLNDKEYVKK